MVHHFFMEPLNHSKFFLFFRLWQRLLSRRRGLLIRALMCWAIGSMILINDELTSYDTRLQIRGAQPLSEKIVIINLTKNDILKHSAGTKQMDVGNEVTESFFWDPSIWNRLLSELLKQKPRKIGVSLFFSESLGNNHKLDLQILQDPHIVWAATTGTNEKTNFPLLANAQRSNVGMNDLSRDEDGFIRKLNFSQSSSTAHLVEKLTDLNLPNTHSLFINYRGSSHFANYSLSDVLYNKVPKNTFKDKIILIGAETSSQYLTPLGSSTRADILAQIADNTLESRWIYRAPNFIYIFGLFWLMVFSVYIIRRHPQSVAFAILAWTATLTAALSVWVFDSYYIWFPLVSPAMQLAATWVIFIGYQANKAERLNWQLKQEQKYLNELEQLKNNFVSLISHDLKTPIAKIQAIVDRLLTQHPTHEFTGDLKSLRSSSEELNRYIRSILNVLRVESRDFKLHLEIGDINELIQEASNQLKPLAFEKQITIESDLEPLFSIEMDFTLIREVMVNLLDNAIKYTPTGGKVIIRSEETDHFVTVKVQDTGQGIAAEEIESIWGKFVRGRDQDLKTKGTGLGLYLVKYFIELHGGKVQLNSEINKGTTVSFSLPLEEIKG